MRIAISKQLFASGRFPHILRPLHHPMSYSLILTHPGGSHKDEFLACSLLLTNHPVKIVRREPTPEDLANPATAVVDVGGEHTPERGNFDHHQFPHDHPPLCALSLVLQHLGVYDDARAFCDWLEPAEWFDTLGAVETSRRLGIDRDTMAKLNSPIDITLLRRFATCRELNPGDPLWEVMRWIGGDLLDYLRNLRERLNFIDTHSQIWEIAGTPGTAKVLYLPRTDPLPDDPSGGIERYIMSHPDGRDIVGMIYPDRRGSGFGLSRHNDHPRLDFTRLADCPDVHFAHARGFVAKTSATTPERLRELMTRAWT